MKRLVCLVMVAIGAAAAGAAQAEQAADLDAKLAEAKAALAAGNFDAAVAAARPVARDARDNDVKNGAMRLVANALRKKGDWVPAAKSYAELKARFEKTSDACIIAEGTAAVLQMSPEGVYPGLTPSASGDDKKPTLADDAYLAQALAKLGETRTEKLKLRVATLRAAATPEALIAQLKEILDGYHAARVLAPKLPQGAEMDAAKAADARMETLSLEAQQKLRAKLADMQRDIDQGDKFADTRRQEAADYSQICQNLVASEEAFRDALKGLGAAKQPDVRELTASNQKRLRDETAFAQQFQRMATRRR